MLEAIIVLFVSFLIAITILISPILVKKARKRLQRRSFPRLWNFIIDDHLPIYSYLSPGERKRLQGHIQVFLAEKQFIGCAGLHLTEEMKLLIAANACLLLLNERGQYFPRLRSILIYPTAYIVKQTTVTGNHIVEESLVARLGESWTTDQLILSWEQVKQDTCNWGNGHNVVLHEFAHQLDQEDGQAEGVPILRRKSDYSTWSKVMTAEYKRLCEDVQKGVDTVLDRYGVTNPAEFFAVATETFFEKPQELIKKRPALYRLLQDYYKLDPKRWVQQSSKSTLS
ncbi:MAG: zinc-dependent peptidase [Mastigocoleus sp. MO_167.B18]|nr:zinc-dependent peptidase [Mastigocoleus sp. MO_167.B18]